MYFLKIFKLFVLLAELLILKRCFSPQRNLFFPCMTPMAVAVDTGIEKKEGNRLAKSCTKIRNTIRDFFTHTENPTCEYLPQKYSYIFRRKSRWELLRMSAVVIGVEFCYAAETAYVTPILLSLGLNVKYVSMIWCFSPLLVFLLTPILGSLSDSCHSRFGRRRPFIFMLSIGLIIGLIFVPYGGRFGLLLGDKYDDHVENGTKNHSIREEITSFTNHSFSKTHLKKIKDKMLMTNRISNGSLVYSDTFQEEQHANLTQNTYVGEQYENTNSRVNTRTYGIIITVIGTVFLDFCADGCQSPCRAYLLDITIPQDHAAGLTAFCLNCAVGSTVGYVLAAIKWNIKIWDNILESQTIMAFAIMTVLYLLFLSSSLSSFPEIPRSLLKDPLMYDEYKTKMKEQKENDTEMNTLSKNKAEYSTIEDKDISSITSVPKENGTNEIQSNSVEIIASTGKSFFQNNSRSISFYLNVSNNFRLLIPVVLKIYTKCALLRITYT